MLNTAGSVPLKHFVLRVEDGVLSLWEGPRSRHVEVARWAVPASWRTRVVKQYRKALLAVGHTCDVVGEVRV